jgi:hypothetical protein
LKINQDSFKWKDLLSQHNVEKEEPINLDLGPLQIFLSLLISFHSYKKEPLSIFFNKKKVIYNPESDKFIHKIKYKDEMVIIPDMGNTQAYSDNESSKATKIAQIMHKFISNKTI